MAVYDIRRGQPEEGGERSVSALFSELTSELSTLFRQEVALVKAETSASLATAKAGITALAIGGVLGFAGLIVLLFSAVYGLSTVMHLGWAALIVSVVTLAVAAFAVMTGMRKLKERSMLPKRSMDSLRRDAEVATRRSHEQY
jgi:Protein of unknown function (DUF1469).